MTLSMFITNVNKTPIDIVTQLLSVKECSIYTRKHGHLLMALPLMLPYLRINMINQYENFPTNTPEVEMPHSPPLLTCCHARCIHGYVGGRFLPGLGGGPGGGSGGVVVFLAHLIHPAGSSGCEEKKFSQHPRSSRKVSMRLQKADTFSTDGRRFLCALLPKFAATTTRRVLTDC